MSGLVPGQMKACEACGKGMIGALTKDGKVAPIEVEPDARGNVLIFRAVAGAALAGSFGFREGESVVSCRTLGEGMALFELREQGVPLRLNHFAYCPERDRFKGPR